MSGSLVKIIVGAVLIVVGAWWFIQGSSYIQPLKNWHPVVARPAVADLIILVNGGLAPFVVLLGLLIVWLELDNFKMQKDSSK